jgi:large subunit ribosomal protein L10
MHTRSRLAAAAAAAVEMLASQRTTLRGSTGLRAPKPFSAPVSRGSLQVTAALSRAGKEQQVAELKAKLDDSSIVFAMRFKGIDVGSFQKFRKSMPEGTHITVCKNNLMKVAVQQAAGEDKWAHLSGDGCTGENAWVFIKEDSIPASIKAYAAFEESMMKMAKIKAPKGTEPKNPTEIAVAVMDSKLLSAKELKACEKLPTKLELLTTIAMLVKQPATKLATGIKAVSTKLATAVKKVSELDEDTSKTVASVQA